MIHPRHDNGGDYDAPDRRDELVVVELCRLATRLAAEEGVFKMVVKVAASIRTKRFRVELVHRVVGGIGIAVRPHAGDGGVEPVGGGEEPEAGVHVAGVEVEEPRVTVEILADEAAVLGQRARVVAPDILLAEGAVGGAFVAHAVGRVEGGGRMHHADRAELVAEEVGGLAVDEPEGGMGGAGESGVNALISCRNEGSVSRRYCVGIASVSRCW